MIIFCMPGKSLFAQPNWSTKVISILAVISILLMAPLNGFRAYGCMLHLLPMEFIKRI